MPAECVMEALPASEVSPVSMGGSAERIGILALHSEDEGKRFVWVFDLGYLMRGSPSTIDSSSQVMITRHGNHSVGLLVSELHGVPEFHEDQIIPTPFAGNTGGMLITEVIKANNGQLLIQGINVGHLFTRLLDPTAPVPAELVDLHRLAGIDATQPAYACGSMLSKAA
jgi:hypothetical protein